MKFYVAAGIIAAILGSFFAYAGVYGLNVLFRHGGTYWMPIAIDSQRLSPSMRLALAKMPVALPGEFRWQTIAPGFDTAELPAMVDDKEVDRILLARIDPDRFRFAVYNSSSGDKNIDQWMEQLGAALIVNGSYYSRYGLPDTPFLSNGTLLGPSEYDGKAGAFVSSESFTGIRDLAHKNWKEAFQGTDNAMVSYPLLIASGKEGVLKPSRWLANRSFIGQDKENRILIGTTRDAFFSIDRLATFLLAAPLELTFALNLDGGPVASQTIALNGYKRETIGRWEVQVNDNRAKLLVWPYGDVALPIVLAVFPQRYARINQ